MALVSDAVGQTNFSQTFGTGISEYYNKQPGLLTTSSFVNALAINCRGLRDGVIVIHNTTSGGDLDYEIIATNFPPDDITTPTGTDDDDKGWVVLKSASIASTIAPDKFSLGDTWTQVLIRIKHTSDSTIAVITHRGET